MSIIHSGKRSTSVIDRTIIYQLRIRARSTTIPGKVQGYFRRRDFSHYCTGADATESPSWGNTFSRRFLPSSSFSQLCRNGPGAAIHSSPRERQFNLAWAEIAISAAQKSPPGVHLLAARPRSNEMSRESKEEFSRRQRERERERWRQRCR